MPLPKGSLFLLVCLLSTILWPASLYAKDQSAVVLLTLEWPPYTGVKLTGNGFIAQRVRAAYTVQGQEAKIGFFSWRRSINLFSTDHRYAGLFPAYPSLDRKGICLFSDPVGASAVGLAQLRNKPLQWRQVENLSRYRLGVVNGYANEDGLDRLIQDGRIKIVDSDTDTDNLLHMLKGEVDAVVIDPQVFKWLLESDARLRPYRLKLEMNERLLVTWPLYVCFRKDEEGAALRDRFNAGLAQLQDDSSLFPGETMTAPKPPRKKPSVPKPG